MGVRVRDRTASSSVSDVRRSRPTVHYPLTTISYPCIRFAEQSVFSPRRTPHASRDGAYHTVSPIRASVKRSYPRPVPVTRTTNPRSTACREPQSRARTKSRGARCVLIRSRGRVRGTPEPTSVARRSGNGRPEDRARQQNTHGFRRMRANHGFLRDTCCSLLGPGQPPASGIERSGFGRLRWIQAEQ